jgi:hypothetical protein
MSTETTERRMTDNYQLDASTWAKGRNTLALAALISVIACVAGYISDPVQFHRSYIVAFTYVAATGLGAFFFVMVQYLTGSAWSVTMRRIMENLMITLPVGAILFIPIAFGMKDIYPWMDRVANPFAGTKGAYLTENFFILRTYIYFALWSIWIFAIYYQSTKQDKERSARQMNVIARWSAPGLFLAVVVGTLAAYDWLMSLEPHWYSTIFGLYILAGGALTFMSFVTLICLGFRRAGILKNSITPEHYHDLGKWLFALTAFYTYMGFSQYLLIWYANLPEETIWYRHRSVGGWLWISLAMPFIRFLIPFFVMLSRPAKRSLTMIAGLAIWSIVVEYIDLYWVAMPAYFKTGPQVSWMDFATLAATLSVCALVFWSRFRKNKLAPVGDLRFEQSLRFENA